jgi:hypothetical protein
MKESLQEQLAKLAKSGGLQESTSSSPATLYKPPTPVAKSHTSPAAKNSYEALILEIEELRGANMSLASEISALKASPYAELTQLQVQFNDAMARLKTSEGSNSSLAEDNLRLKRELAEFPSKKVISHWQDKAIQADKHIVEVRALMDQLEMGRQQLTVDSSAFEADLDRLNALDEDLEKLAADQLELADSKKKIDERIRDAGQAEKKLADEQSRLTKLSSELSSLEAKVGYLRGIEKKLKILEVAHGKLSKLYKSSKTRVRNLNTQKDKFAQDKAAAEAVVKLYSDQLKVALRKIDSTPDGEVVIRSLETVQWLVSQFEDPFERVVPRQVLLIGDGPWPIDNFTELLQKLGFEVWQNGCDADIEVVIVGRENWSESAIDAQIEERDGESLRVYPQELFVMLLAMQTDPLKVADPEALLRFVDGHPVFEYLFIQEFPWPENIYEVGPPGTIQNGFDGADASSPLYKMGYSVAQQAALSPSQRQYVLEKTFSEEYLPWCISDEYMADWGTKNSRKRLRRIAWHLFLMTKIFKRHVEAVARWESDLHWLKRTHYKPIQRFRWPS